MRCFGFTVYGHTSTSPSCCVMVQHTDRLACELMRGHRCHTRAWRVDKPRYPVQSTMPEHGHHMRAVESLSPSGGAHFW
jgi:hypothetical protein